MTERVYRRLAPGARDDFLATYVCGSAATAVAANRMHATRARLRRLATGEPAPARPVGS